MKIVKYLCASFLIICGIASMFKSSFIGGLLVLIAGLIIIPQISELLKIKFAFWHLKKARIIGTIAILLIGMIITGKVSGKNKSNSKNDYATNEKGDIEDQNKAIRKFVKANKEKPLLKNLQTLEEWNNIFNVPASDGIIYFSSDFYSENYIELNTEKGNTNYALYLDKNKDKNIETKGYLNPVDGFGQLKNYSVVFTVNNNNEIIKTVAKFKNDKNEVKEITDLNFDIKKFAKLDNIKKQTIITEKIIAKREEIEAQERYRVELEKKKDEWNKNYMSEYDGSCKPLIRYVEPQLNDPDSFEHIETRVRRMDDYMLVVMKYRAKNAFNALVVGVTTAKVNFDGEVIGIE